MSTTTGKGAASDDARRSGVARGRGPSGGARARWLRIALCSGLVVLAKACGGGDAVPRTCGDAGDGPCPPGFDCVYFIRSDGEHHECRPNCRHSTECLRGYDCRWYEGLCRVRCDRGEACPSGEVCADGMCARPCRSDDDCREVNESCAGYNRGWNRCDSASGTADCICESSVFEFGRPPGRSEVGFDPKGVVRPCEANEDCPDGQWCAAVPVGYREADSPGECMWGCRGDADCGAGRFCLRGMCHAGDAPCYSDADCGDGEVCRSGQRGAWLPLPYCCGDPEPDWVRSAGATCWRADLVCMAPESEAKWKAEFGGKCFLQ